MRAISLLAVLIALLVVSVAAWAQDVPATVDDGSDPSATAGADDTPSLSGPVDVGGRVVIALRCPVPLGSDDACPDRPFPTTVLVNTPDGQQVAAVKTADDGTFSIALEPGQYRVDPLLGDGSPSANGSVVVDVPAGSPVTLTIRIRGGAAVLVP